MCTSEPSSSSSIASSPALLWTIPSALNHGESGAKQCVRQSQILACGKSAALRPGGPTCFLRQSEERRKLQAGSSVRARLLSESRRDVRHPNLSLRSRFCPRFALAFDRLLRADRLCHGIKERKASIVFQVAQDPDRHPQT